ncbi:MAG: valine--tRNA ligase [Methanomassiliicoccales archaeon]|nr:valine--tRNA ligase [Methanomassiliicoccales archaeon]
MSYDHVISEKKWQLKWKEWKIHHFDPSSDKPVYSVDNPPRYTSGSLHLGHATGYSLIDFAARYHRQRGFNVFFPLCFDVNGTPTEVKVEKKYGITKLSIPRQEYIKLCSEFAQSFITEMTRQFEVLGTCMDPTIYYQTDAPSYRRITQITFLRMLDRGLVYKGTAPVNWCPRCITALADAEVEHDDNVTKLNYIRFGRKDGEGVFIATTRPELLSTCQLVAVHPDDLRFKDLVGRMLTVPIYGREVKVVADDKVDPDFGTGVVMICTIGDKGDLDWVRQYNLALEQAIDEQGYMTEHTGQYTGLKVKEARARVIEDLKALGLVLKQEDLEQNVSICWRCHEPIEYLSRPQWFLKTLDFKQDVLRLADELHWYPEFMKVRLQDWVNSLGWDWVISRQRYFATPIPVWECEKCGQVIPAREEDCYIDPTVSKPPVESCPKCGGELKPCQDVFDTWMDSSISPLYNTFWMRDEKRFQKLYPMSLRPQSHDIIRTWAFYTILREHLITGLRPWNDIMIHGFIMAPDGTPMHTSSNNVIDPMPILESFGADALRYFACTCALGEDNAFREKDVLHGKKLCTKLYNMGKFVGTVVKHKPYMRDDLKATDKWMLSRFSKTLKQVSIYYDNYQFDKVMREVEQFAWHEFADHYIELVKHRTQDLKDEAVRYTLYTVCLGIMKMLAPLLPHVTEEVYQENFVRMDRAKSIHVSKWPIPVFYDDTSERKGVLAKDIVAAIRNWKAERGLPLNATLASVEIIGANEELMADVSNDILQTVKAQSIKLASKADLEERVLGVKPVLAKIGPTFKAQAKEVTEALKQLRPNDIVELMETGSMLIPLSDGTSAKVTSDFVQLLKQLTLHGQAVETVQLGEMLIAISK